MNFGLIGLGAALAFAAIGSALGMGAAGMAAVGAWKKCFAQSKSAPFILIILADFASNSLSARFFRFMKIYWKWA